MVVSGVARVMIRIPCRRASSKAHDVNLWKEINRLASEGKWDSINNMPRMFLFGKAKRETYAVYNAYNKKTDIWSSSPYGQIAKLLFRYALFFGSIKVGYSIYEFFVPEEMRLKYKYKHKEGHEEGHGHH